MLTAPPLTPPPFSRRINIGSRYQAEVPELRQQPDVELDRHAAELVWAPLAQLVEQPEYQQKGQQRSKQQAPNQTDMLTSSSSPQWTTSCTWPAPASSTEAAPTRSWPTTACTSAKVTFW